jgi:hypothetical protein
VMSEAGADATEEISSVEHAATEATRAHKRIPSTERELPRLNVMRRVRRK